ncbi:MAG: SH3 domain-containing protein [Proteobacteria bacterium]|nr:SH3 domain-containing protein [Pseudomonadota bacterium]
MLAVFGIASAQDAFTSRPMNVRAGPNRDYPLVAQLAEGAPLDIHGCLSDWSWCDASFDDGRGWIYAGGLSFVYEGERVPLYSYGPHLGLPIITFSLVPYWDHYYRRRPWYSQRNDWEHRRLPRHMRPPGRPYAGRPPMPHGRPMPQGQRPMPYGRPMPQGRRPMPYGRPMPQGQRPMPHGRPPTEHGRAPMEHKRPPMGGRPAPRNEARGHAPPHGRPMQGQQHAPGPKRGGREGPNRGPDHNDRGNGGRPGGPP